MKRSVLIAIPAILVTLIVILVVAPGFIDWNQYKGQAQDQIKTATGFNAELRGPISMALLPTPHLSIEDVRVAAPEGSAGDTLLQLGRADVHLAFIPLLSGNIAFDSVTLVEPRIALEVLPDGRQNWMTPELEQKSKAGGSAPKISLKKFSIEKGAFTYTDRSKGKAAPTTIADINIDASADTLSGPFKADGDFATSGHTIDFNATTGAIDETGAMTIKAEGTEKPSDIKFNYAGVVTTKEPFQLQGETDLQMASLKELAGLDGGWRLKGLVTASQQKVEFKNASFILADNEFSGDVAATLNPLKITGDFKASDTVSIDKFIKGGGKKSDRLLPDPLILPMPFDGGIRLSAPGLIYQGQLYNNVTLMASKQDKIFALDFAAAGIPGKGKVDAKAAMKYAAKSVSQKDGSETYSEPSLIVTVKGNSLNTQQTVEAVTGMKDLGFLQAWKTGAMDANVAILPDSFTFKETTITLGDSSFQVSGSYAPAGAMDMMVSGRASDAKAFAKLAGMDASSLPKSLEGGNVKIAAKGTREKLVLNADIEALKGNLIVKTDINDPFEKAAFSNMAIEIKHPNLADALQAFSPGSTRYVSLEKPLSFYAEIEPKGTVYSLKNMKAVVAGTPVTGTMSVDTGAAKPAIKGDLAFQDLNIQAQGAHGSKSGSPWSSEPMDTTWMNGYEVALGIKANSIVYNSWNLQKPILNVALHGGKLNMKQLDATLFGGEMKMTAAMEAGASNKGYSSVQTSATFRSVSMEPLVKAMVGTAIIKASGDIDFDTTLTTSGSSQMALVSGLKGSANTSGRKLVLEGFDLSRFAESLAASAKPGERLSGLWQSRASGGSTAFDTMDGAFSVTGGIVNILKLDLDGASSAMATTGNVNLPNWTLATAHTITFKDKPEIKPYTIKMSGSLSNPAQSLGQGLVNDYLGRQIGNVINEQLGGKLQENGLGKVLGDTLGIPGLGEAPAAKAPKAAKTATATTPTTTPVTAAPITAPKSAAPVATPQHVEPTATPVANEAPAAAPAEVIAPEAAPDAPSGFMSAEEPAPAAVDKPAPAATPAEPSEEEKKPAEDAAAAAAASGQ